MKFDRAALAKTAVLNALQMRAAAGFSIWDPVCVFDLAERLGVEVRFTDIPSMEGIYSGPKHSTIIISSLRPAGRQSYTCGHELGHHKLGHGTQFDELIRDRTEPRRFDPKEYQADCFAGALLMPQGAVKHGFSLRSWDPNTCAPESFYIVASWLGVGYATLIQHMWRVLKQITKSRSERLLGEKPQMVRSRLLGEQSPSNVFVADQHWYGRAIDVQVTDFIILPGEARLEGTCFEVIDRARTKKIVRASSPGLGRVAIDANHWSAFVRVSRLSYVGRAKYRFEEEVEDGQ